jgi:hypothetical protein
VGCGRHWHSRRQDAELCTVIDVVVSFWPFWREATLFFIAKAVFVLETDPDPSSWPQLGLGSV